MKSKKYVSALTFEAFCLEIVYIKQTPNHHSLDIFFFHILNALNLWMNIYHLIKASVFLWWYLSIGLAFLFSLETITRDLYP